MKGIELRFHPEEVYYLSTYDFKLIDKLEDGVIYFNDEPYEYEGKEYKSRSYLLNYIYNGAIGCGYSFFPHSKGLGFHNVDRERLKIR